MSLKRILISLLVAFISGFTVVSFLNFFHRGRAGFFSLLGALPVPVYVVAFLIFTGSYLLEALRLVYLVWHKGYKISFWGALYNTMIGYLFSFLTPFAMGGQPFQVVHLSRLGVDSGYATGIMGTRVLENSLGGAVIAVIMLNTSLGWLLKRGHMVILGIFISISVSTAIFLAMLKPGILIPIVRVISKLFKLSNLEESFKEWRERFESSIKYMWRDNAYLMFLDATEWFSALVLQIYSLYYILHFLSKMNLNFWMVFGSVNAVNALAYFIPTPGAAGGIEFTYQFVLSGIVGNSEVALKSVTAWRFVSYYGQILLGMLVLGFFKFPKVEGNR